MRVPPSTETEEDKRRREERIRQLNASLAAAQQTSAPASTPGVVPEITASNTSSQPAAIPPQPAAAPNGGAARPTAAVVQPAAVTPSVGIPATPVATARKGAAVGVTSSASASSPLPSNKPAAPSAQPPTVKDDPALNEARARLKAEILSVLNGVPKKADGTVNLSKLMPTNIVRFYEDLAARQVATTPGMDPLDAYVAKFDTAEQARDQLVRCQRFKKIVEHLPEAQRATDYYADQKNRKTTEGKLYVKQQASFKLEQVRAVESTINPKVFDTFARRIIVAATKDYHRGAEGSQQNLSFSQKFKQAVFFSRYVKDGSVNWNRVSQGQVIKQGFKYYASKLGLVLGIVTVPLAALIYSAQEAYKAFKSGSIASGMFRVLTTGGSIAAGATGGAMLGALIGTALFPGAGTAIGAAIGGALGALAGAVCSSAIIAAQKKVINFFSYKDKLSKVERADLESKGVDADAIQHALKQVGALEAKVRHSLGETPAELAEDLARIRAGLRNGEPKGFVDFYNRLSDGGPQMRIRQFDNLDGRKARELIETVAPAPTLTRQAASRTTTAKAAEQQDAHHYSLTQTAHISSAAIPRSSAPVTSSPGTPTPVPARPHTESAAEPDETIEID